MGKSIDLLCLWAHRSAPFPLHIVYLQPYRSCMSQVKFLLLHAHRWKTLHGGSIRPMLDLLKYYQDIGSPVLPLLKCAYLSDRDPMKVSHSLASRCALPFPSLVSLTLNNFHVLFRISKLSNLRKLTLEESAITPTELSGLSIAAPGLSVLLLRQVDREVNGDSERIVTFRSLTELCFVSMNWEAILSHINAPCLKTLSCTGGYLRPSFVGFTQTFPLLTHIHLGQCKVQNWNNRNTHDGHLFRHTPSLTHLNLIECTNLVALLTFLNNGHNEGALIPNLDTVSVVASASSEDLTTALLLFNQQCRWRGLRQLKLGKILMEALGPGLEQNFERADGWEFNEGSIA